MTVAGASAGERIIAELDGWRGAAAEYPFGPQARVYKVMGKMFALLTVDADPAQITLKAAPADCVALESMFEAVRPGYHMNKQHWITVDLDGDAAVELVLDWARDSYALVVSGLRKRDRERLALEGDPDSD